MQQPAAPAIVSVKKAATEIYRQRENVCKSIQQQIDFHLNEIVKLRGEQSAVRDRSMIDLRKVTPFIWQIRQEHDYNSHYFKVQSFFTEQEAVNRANRWLNGARGYSKIIIVKIPIEVLPARFSMGKKWVDDGELISAKEGALGCCSLTHDVC